MKTSEEYLTVHLEHICVWSCWCSIFYESQTYPQSIFRLISSLLQVLSQSGTTFTQPRSYTLEGEGCFKPPTTQGSSNCSEYSESEYQFRLLAWVLWHLMEFVRCGTQIMLIFKLLVPLGTFGSFWVIDVRFQSVGKMKMGRQPFSTE